MPSFRIATRFLRSSRNQTILVVVGIAVLISVQVFVGALIGSLQQNLVESTVGNSPQVTVLSSRDNVTIDNWTTIVTQIQATGGVRFVAVSASGNAFLTNGAKVAPVLVRGFDFAQADAIYHMLPAVYRGAAPQSDTQVLVGKELSQDLNLQVGQTVTVITAFGSHTNLTISGLFDLGVASLNEGWVMTPLATAQSIFGYGNRVTSVEAAVTDVFQARSVAATIVQALANPDVKVQNWMDQNAQLLSGLQAQSLSSNMIQAFILVSVVIAIASILSITVVQKSRQIGILKAMGIKDRAASLVFLYEGMLLGIVGALLGLLLGVGLLTSFTTFAKGTDGKPIISITLDAVFLVESFLIAFLSAVVAGVLPARKSSRLSPIDVIRGN
jgi:lipoprotein-releasing system permease protein